MGMMDRPYVGTWQPNRTVVRYTPDPTPLAFSGMACYDDQMQSKDQRYAKAQDKKANKPEGVCSRYPNCIGHTDGQHRLCPKCLGRSLANKEMTKQRVKAPTECHVLTCRNLARPSLTRCERCAAKGASFASQPRSKQRRAELRKELRAEVIAAYGGVCACCNETRLPFLTIDHETRYNGEGPKTGSSLYLWLKSQDFPSGFRVLCHSCNFALGLFGYCPHSNLVQPLPDRPILDRTRKLQAKHRERNLKNKLDAFNAYGGVSCQCCHENHHECLTIDHLDNKGGEHRKALAGKPIYRWLAHEGYPEGFQVLCLSCNVAKRFHSICPHKISEGG